MLVAREGKPGSGKSYELVSVDLVENLRQGRRVYARINGLNFDAIASHIGVTVDRVRELLTTMTDEQVREWLVCDTIGDAFDFPHLAKGSLVIVDECHDFWPVSRVELPDRVAAFFAKHRHWGLDIAIATQDMREVHRSVLRRLDRKNLYAKLDALGREGDYTVRGYVSPRPGSFEQLSVERRSYKPDIFPLYRGVQPGVDNAGGVYSVGSKTFWQSIRKWAILIGLVLIASIYGVLRFFLHPEATAPGAVARPSSTAAPLAPTASSVAAARLAAQSRPSAAGGATMPVQPTPPPVAPDPPGVAYIRELLKTARPRYLGDLGRLRLVEFRERSGDRVLERLTDEQLRALGFTVTVTGYGIHAAAERLDIVFTAWPVDAYFQQTVAQTAAINSTPLISGPAMATGTAPLAAADPRTSGASYGSMAIYGGMGVAPPSTGSAGP